MDDTATNTAFIVVNMGGEFKIGRAQESGGGIFLPLLPRFSTEEEAILYLDQNYPGESVLTGIKFRNRAHSKSGPAELKVYKVHEMKS